MTPIRKEGQPIQDSARSSAADRERASVEGSNVSATGRSRRRWSPGPIPVALVLARPTVHRPLNPPSGRRRDGLTSRRSVFPWRSSTTPFERRSRRFSRARGWRGYFGFCETPSVLHRLDGWVRRRLRVFVWRKWKRGRSRIAALRRFDINPHLAARTAASGHGPWRISNSAALMYALPNAFIDRQGLASLRCRPAAQIRPTAVYGHVCTVVWEG